MACTPINLGDGVAIVCRRGQRSAKCRFCGRPATLLCDQPVGRKKTCSAPMCADCSRREGALDICPKRHPELSAPIPLEHRHAVARARAGLSPAARQLELLEKTKTRARPGRGY